jgi:hypothetical protein
MAKVAEAASAPDPAEKVMLATAQFPISSVATEAVVILVMLFII